MKAGRPTAAELLERESEVEQLAAAIDAALAGEGSALALEGQAGIGKTSLLADASRRACDAGMRVLSARGGELERQFAYGVVRQLFEAPGGGRARRSPALAGERRRPRRSGRVGVNDQA